MRKIENVAHCRSAKRIDRLRVVADDSQAAPARAQGEHDLPLQAIGVLIFVDQQMVETTGDFAGDALLLHHLREIEQEIVVIEHVLTLLGLDIGRKQGAQRLFEIGAPGKMVGQRLGQSLTAVDDARIDGEASPLCRKPLLHIRQAELMTFEIHEVGGIFPVVDGELRIEAEPQRIIAQQPRADRMKRAGVGRGRHRGRVRGEFARQQALHAPVELPRRAPREGRQHDAPGIGAAQDEMGDAMGEHIGLAGAGAGNHQQRRGAVRITNAMFHGLALGVVQFAQRRGGGGRANHRGRHASQQHVSPFVRKAA